MSEEDGKRIVLALVRKYKPEAVSRFQPPSEGQYPLVIQLHGKSTTMEFDEADLADLAHNGGVKAGIEMRIRNALEDLERRL